MAISRDEVELYVMGADSQDARFESRLNSEPETRAMLAEEAHLELLMQAVGDAVSFCLACDAVVDEVRCEDCGAVLRAGGFEVREVLVQNVHGRLYLAEDADGRLVALKELAFVQAPGIETLATFEREANFLRALDHKAIPRFVASFQEGSGVNTRLYIAQDYVEGQALDQRLADHWFDESEILAIATQVLDVLIYLQSLSPMVVHRDIKPANLIQSESGEIAVVDFGAAYDQGETPGATLVGTYGYMPPEQMAGEVSGSSDVFALGSTLLHLLTRREPWKNSEGEADRGANISQDVRALLQKMTASKTSERFPSALEALAALRAIGTGKAVKSAVPANSNAPARWPLALVATLCVGAASTFGVMQLVGDESQSGADEIGGEGALAERDQQPKPTKQAERMGVADPTPLPSAHRIDVEFSELDIHSALQSLGTSADLNIVVPDNIRARVTANFSDVPVDQALEVVLESKGLWYQYYPEGRIVRVATRKEVDQERERALNRAIQGLPDQHDLSQYNEPIDLDYKKADLHELVRLFSDIAGVNIILPSNIKAKVTVRLKRVPWNQALEVILASKGLWYRYRDNGRLIRIATMRELDAEDEAEIERSVGASGEEVSYLTLSVTSEPSGAFVYLGDRKELVGVTPLVLKLRDADTASSLRVEKDGFRSVTRTLDWSRATERQELFVLAP